MSKADSSPSTPASAAKSRTDADRLADLAEARQRIAALGEADAAVGAAEGGDAQQEAAAEAEYQRLSEEFLGFKDYVFDTPPEAWTDVVTRAEIAGFKLERCLLRARPVEWAGLLEDRWHDERAFVQLTLAVLWLARSNGVPANV